MSPLSLFFVDSSLRVDAPSDHLVRSPIIPKTTTRGACLRGIIYKSFFVNYIGHASYLKSTQPIFISDKPLSKGWFSSRTKCRISEPFAGYESFFFVSQPMPSLGRPSVSFSVLQSSPFVHWTQAVMTHYEVVENSHVYIMIEKCE